MFVVLGGDDNASHHKGSCSSLQNTGVVQHYVDIPIELLEQYLENEFTPEQIAGLLSCESRRSDDASLNINSILKKHCITMYLNHSLFTSINVLVSVHFSA